MDNDVVDIYSLTPMQEGMLFHTLLEPESGVYVVQHHGLLDGPLDLATLSASWDQVVERRSVLRSSFEWEELDRPLQVVHRSVHLPLVKRDFTDLRPEDREARWDQLLRDDRRQGFDLAQVPLMRFVVVRVGPESHRFLWSHHHILVDGWSLPLLLNEVFSIYEARRKGTKLQLPAARPFRTYIDWIEGQDPKQAQDFWRRKLAGFQEPIRLGIDSGVESREPSYDEETVTLSSAQTQRLEAFCRERQLTLNTLVQGAWVLVLACYSGRRDLVLGEVVSGRSAPLPGIESIVGPLINTLPNRVVMKYDLKVDAWLADLQRDSTEMRHYEFTPLASIQKQSDLAPGVPLFEYLCAFENFPLDVSIAARSGVSLQLRELAGIEQVNYPLALMALPQKEQLSLRAIYATHRFQGWSLRQLLAHVEQVLEAFVANPHLPLGAIDVVSSREREQLLVEWNDTATPYPAHRRVHELFEEQVARSPEAVAAVFGETELSYGELNARANQLAHALRARGVGPESLVALCVERSADMVVGMLGILKAGAAYVPLDTAYPPERLAFMLQDSRANVLLTQRPLLAVFPPHQAEAVCIDDESTYATFPKEDPESRGNADDIAYMIYTSGSTGRPKGVAVPHHAVTRLVTDPDYVEILPGDRIAQASNASFDAATFEVWGALLNGAVLVWIPTEVALSPPGMYEALRRDGITTLFITTALFNQLVAFAGDMFATLRHLLFGGEAVDPRWVRKVLQEGPPRRILHVYGPTENTTFSTWHLVQEVEPDAATVPIGKPISRTQAYVLDRNLDPVPVGVPGELLLGGDGLARDYWQRPALTAEKFVPHPYGREPGARLYRTGDVARWLPGGAIEFLGRRDFQVKLRGFRIELGEIETALLAHHDVQEAVVMLRQEERGHKRLVGYVVPDGGGAPPSVGDLRDHLSRRLPAYMVPSAFVALPAFPLTPNGKVDRSALPAPDGDRPDVAEFVPPRNTTEEVLAEVLRETLGIERVGIHDSFFALGGDSILGIQMISKLQRKGFECTPLELFQNQTVAKLATVVRRPTGPQAEQGEVTGPVALTPIQHWFLDGEPMEPQHFNQSLLLEVHGGINTGHLAAALEHLVSHHDALRLQFSRTGGRWQQVNAPVTEQSCLTCLDLSARSEGEQAATIERICAETQAGFDLSSGLLLRALFFDLGRGLPGRLLLVVHHLAVDGVSWRVLLEDLLTAFRQASAGKAVSLPPKTHSFQEWADRLGEYAGSEKLAEERDYWCELVESAGDAEFPLDRPDGGNRVAQTRQAVRVLDKDLTQNLLRDVPPVYHTQINDLLLAALIDAYHGWSGKERLLVDLEGHGRQDVFPDLDVSRTVGWFTCIYPVLLECERSGDPGELLISVKEQLRRVPRQGLGYGVLRFTSGEGMRETLEQGPSATVSFNYLGQLDRGLGEETELFRPAAEAKGDERSGRAERPYALDIAGYVLEGRLQISWQYGLEISDRTSVEDFADTYVTSLRRLVEHCLEPDAGAFTPSDFPLAEVSREQLEELVRLCPDVDDIYTLTPLQEGLLFHTLYAPKTGIYLTQMSCRLKGILDEEVFARAWKTVIQRHPIARTSFHWRGLDRMHQVVHRDVEMPTERLDWRELSPGRQEEALERFLEDNYLRDFSIESAPMMRVALIRLSPDACYLVWCHHHVLIDGWSSPLLLSEVFTCYETYLRGEEPALPTVHPFRDYIRLIREKDLSESRAFWKTQLAGFERPTPLGVEVVEAGAEIEHGELPYSFPPGLTQRLSRFASDHQLTLNTLIQGAWSILLSRYSGDDDVIMGATVSGRPASLPGVESMVGLFLNAVPVRVVIDPHARLSEWLQSLQEQAAQIRHHEHLPLVEIQKLSHVPSGEPLFESLFVFENYPIDAFKQSASATLTIEDTRTHTRLSYPLNVLLAPREDLLALFVYDGTRFTEEKVEQLGDHLVALLFAFLEDPDCRLAEISMQSAAARESLLRAWDDNVVEFPADRCIHQLFEEQAARTPDATAVTHDGSALTYGELNDRANQLGRHLRACAVGTESMVAIFVERSAEMLVGLLGILKSGAAYVPLDPEYPPDRLTFTLDDCQAEVIVTQKKLVQRLPAHGARVICMDADGEEIRRHATGNLDQDPPALGTAYVIYTSGSTGRPKGIPIPHRSAVALLAWAGQVFAEEELAGVLSATSICFDLSIFEMFLPLSRGGKVIVAANALELYELPEVDQVTLVNTVPSAMRELLRMRDLPDSVRVVNLAGEPLPTSLVAEIHEKSTVEKVYDLYGPSEDTTYSTFALRRGDGPATIGSPIGNTQAYALDRYFQPVPVGVAGELYLGGAGLARGYLNRPGLTAECFVPDPFGRQVGSRLYRTGDRVRWMPDGTLEFLGRIDYQVKIRGYRIELGEIEATLASHDAVREAVVLAREDEANQKRLVAYVVPDPEWQEASDEPEQADEQVQRWQELWGVTYADAEADDPTFNIVGWQSSYTGEPIPAAEMRTWRDSRVEQLLALEPQHVLEIGCGTGLLLSRIAPHCASYHGTDFSQAALDFLEQALPSEQRANLTLSCRNADDFSGLDEQAYDLLIINSVVQYFPTIDYLHSVLQGAVRCLRPGGTLYVGDVRDLRLLEAFHTDVQRFRSRASLSTRELRQIVRTRVGQEKELLVDPAYFEALCHQLSLAPPEFRVQRGRHRNELNLFRYDVLVRTGEPDAGDAVTPEVGWSSWAGDAMSLGTLRERLADEQSEVLAFSDVPNARLQRPLHALQLLSADEVPAMVGDLHAELEAGSAGDGIDPEELYSLAAALGYSARIGCAADPSALQVLLSRDGVAGNAVVGSVSRHRGSPPLETFANRPLRGLLGSELVSPLRSYLETHLPNYMVPSAFVFLDALPLTPNGKINRKKLPAPGGARPDLAGNYVAPRNETEETLAEVLGQVLGIDHVGVHDNFFALGGDSILSIQVVSRMRAAGLECTPVELFQNQTVAKMAAVVRRVTVPTAEQGEVTGPVPWMPIQRWFLDKGPVAPEHFNQSLLFEVHGEIDTRHLEAAFQALLRHHDMLRLLVSHEGGVWSQCTAPVTQEPCLTLIDLSRLEESRQAERLTEHCNAIQASFDLGCGRMLRAVFFPMGAPQPDRLLIVIHHFAVDGVSWRILLEDLYLAYDQLTRGHAVSLPAKTTSYRDWATRLRDFASTEALAAEAGYWQALQSSALGAGFPVEQPEGLNSVASAVQVTRSLDEQETESLLREVPSVYHTQINDVLLSALIDGYQSSGGAARLLVDVEGHGREDLFDDVDLSRTVGWFTTLYPILLEKPDSAGPGERLKRIKEQLRRVPHQGIGYGLLRYLAPEGIRLGAGPEANVSFNYLGQVDRGLAEQVSLLRPAQDSRGFDRAPEAHHDHAVAVTGYVQEGRLNLTFRFSQNLHRRDTIERFADAYMESLQKIIQHCLDPESGGYTPSDFELAGLDQEQLDSLLGQVDQRKNR